MFKSGLFSAVGTVSLVESYKWLSPDSGDETVDLLGELVNVTQKIFLTPGSGEPFKRTFDIVAINVIWFASIDLCLFCAVYATLLQQWNQRYLALAHSRGTPKDARVQLFLYRSLKRFQLPWIRQSLLMGLHFSIALYALGITLFIFHIDRNLIVLPIVAFSLSGSIYAALTMLPIFYWDSPYSTPFSILVWCIWHRWWAVNFSIYSGIANLLSCLLPRWWANSLQDRADKHIQWYKDGLEKTIERHAENFHA